MALPRPSCLEPVELSLYPARFSVRQIAAGSSALEAQVVTGLRIGGTRQVEWQPVTRHTRLGTTETQTIHLPRPMAGHLADFVLTNLAGSNGKPYTCFGFTEALNGRPVFQQVPEDADETA